MLHNIRPSYTLSRIHGLSRSRSLASEPQKTVGRQHHAERK